MKDESEYSENTERLDTELNHYNDLRTSIVSEDEEIYWYNPAFIKDISDGVRKKLIGIAIICSIFIVAEAIGAYISDSVAIFTDVAHLFSDLIGFIISLVSVSLAKKRASLKHSYGYIRAESVGALFSVVLIWGLTIWILYKSIMKLVEKDYRTLDPFYMLGSAVLGLIVNIIMALFLHSHGSGHGHSHCHEDGHSHGNDDKHIHSHEIHKEIENTCDHKTQNIKKKKIINGHQDQKKQQVINNHNKTNFNEDDYHAIGNDDHEPLDDYNHDEESNNLKQHFISKKKHKNNLSMVNTNDNHNIQAAWIHILGDLLQSIGVVIFATIIYFKNDWKFLDPVISIVFVFIAASFSIPIAKSIINIMLDSTPPGMDIEKFLITLQNIKHVTEIHDLHVWNLTHGKPAMTAHILVDDKIEYVLKKATIECRKIGIYHTTIQVERLKASHQINCEHNLHR